MPLYLFLYYGAKKSKMTKNSNQGGGVLPLQALIPIFFVCLYSVERWQVFRSSSLLEEIRQCLLKERLAAAAVIWRRHQVSLVCYCVL